MIQFLCLVSLLLAYNVEATYNIFIMAGQSNMEGRGGNLNHSWDGYVPPLAQPNPSIFRLNGNNTWEKAAEPIHRGIYITSDTGVGPGMAFANTVLRKYPDYGCIGLVPCARGFTNISQWERGTFFYDHLIAKANIAVKGGGILRAILWYQGENDGFYEDLAVQYKKNLEKFFLDVRADLGSPSLPIIQVAITTKLNMPYYNMIREIQLGTKLPNVWTVDAKGLELMKDNAHLTSDSEAKIGEKMADAFLNHFPPHSVLRKVEHRKSLK